MRILRIAHASLTPQLRERERALARCYPDVQLEVVTTERWREAEVDVEAIDDDLFPVRKARPHFSRHIQLFVYDPRPIARALRQFQPDLIDLNAEPYSVQCAEVLTLRNWFAPRVPVVLGTSQNIFHRYPPPFNLFERRGLKQAAAAYGCSETVRDLLIAKGFRKTIRVIPFGVNLTKYTFRDRLVRQSKTLTIGFVGRMLPGKGLNILSEALERISSDDWKLLVVGNGPEREPFTQRLEKLDLIQRAQFAGAVNYEEMPRYFQEIDLLVVPTQTTARIREQFGRVIVEAMASGVPVIGSTCGAIPEVIGDAGLVVPEGDADALAAAIERLLASENLRRQLARAGRERVERHYSWENVASQMYELFRDVLRPAAEISRTPRAEAAALNIMPTWKPFTEDEARLAWDDALARFDDCSPFQSYAWGEYRRGLGWQPYRWAAVNEANEIVAMLQAYLRRHRFGIGMLWSEGGPVGDLSVCDETLQSIIRETVGLKRLYCRFRCDQPRAVQKVLELKAQGWNVPWAAINSGYTAVLNLKMDDKALLAQATRNWRANVRRAEKNNLVTYQWLNPTAEAIHSAFRSMEKAKGLDEQHSRDEIEQLLEKAGHQLILFRSDDKRGELMSLAGAMVFGSQANLWLFATTQPGRTSRASYLVLSALVQHCKQVGVTSYDLGGIDPVNNPGVSNFKTDSGGTPVELLGEWDWATQSWLRWFGNWAIQHRSRVRRAENALKKQPVSEPGAVATGSATRAQNKAVNADALSPIETNSL